MKIKNILSLVIPQRVYTDEVFRLNQTEIQNLNGETLILQYCKTFGEDVAYQCVEKHTKVMRGFIVKNIKYGYFGDICDTVQEALNSANDKWFVFMGIKKRQKHK